MPKSLVRHIQALNEYARDGAYLHEGWASTVFKRTYRAALEGCSDIVQHSLGVQVSWYPEDPVHVTVYRTNMATERLTVLRQLPLEGTLGQALFEEMRQLAVVRAEDALRQERDDSLHRAAVSRVEQLLKQVRPAEPPGSVGQVATQPFS